MALSLLVLYCLLTFTNFTANPNIILTKEQLDHLLFFILVPLYVVVLLGSAGFYRNYNQERIFCCWNFFRQMPCCILSSRSTKILTTMSIFLPMSMDIFYTAVLNYPAAIARLFLPVVLCHVTFPPCRSVIDVVASIRNVWTPLGLNDC